MTKCLMLAVILLPVLAGISLPLLHIQSRPVRLRIVGSALIAETILVTLLVFMVPMDPAAQEEMTLISMSEQLKVSLKVDGLSRIFMMLAAFGFLAAGFFAFRYMEHEEKEGAFSENTFFLFYLLTLGVLMGMDMSSNLIGMYFFFEMITLLSMPMVLHERTKESINAALKYLFYSVAGAFMALGCIFTLSVFCDTMMFTPGGSLNMAAVQGHEILIMVMLFLGVVGFGAKAGMYPLHGWLPTAHPVAPAPGSAVLSGIIAKAGVLAIIRIIFFSAGASILAGSWVQITLLSLSLLTVFMGSMMAYRENVMKKRLAYSSVSQISYVLFGLFLMNPDGITGGLMQVLFHGFVKICLFLVAGSFIFNKGYHHVKELKGIGKEMPVTLGAFTLASLSLIGIPPFAGFVSKWYLAEGALETGIQVISWLGPVILLISALLTAGYLLPITVDGFFPGKDYKEKKSDEGDASHKNSPEGGLLMKVPLVALAILSLVLGLSSGVLREFFSALAVWMLG